MRTPSLLFEYARNLKSDLEKLKIGDKIKAIHIENGIEKNIEIVLSKEHNINYEIQKFFIYNWKKTKKVINNSIIFNNQMIIDPGRYYDIFRIYEDVEDLKFLYDFIDIKQKL